MLRSQNKLLEAQRLEARTKYDLEMLREIGYCQGIENYSRHLTGQKAGRAAAHAHGLPPQGCPRHDRREPRHGAADPGHVPGRQVAKGDARGVRVPTAFRPRQPAPHVRGVRGARQTRRVYVSATPGHLRADQGKGPRGRADRAARRASWTPSSR